MTDEQTQILDSVLAEWDHWALNRIAVRGYAACAVGMELYRTSRQHDDANGALDSDLDAMRNRQIDYEVQQMVDPYRAAVYVIARNARTGFAVWRSPRLPADEAERQRVVHEARKIIRFRLICSGIL